MKVSTNFHLKEFIDKKTYQKWGEASLWFIDPRIIQVAQFIRTRHGKAITINGTLNGHTYNYSGFDPPRGYRKATSLSQHQFGRAVDLKFSGMTVQEAYKDIIDNQDVYLKIGLTTVENIEATPSWLHIDIRETRMDVIKIVNP
ncbi:hypothetical protein LCGC14_0388830 [marine sediment metagenome]|uniref:Peptidase M15A C-terminal domain-containing protein n=1 Tax=marine sediment metagenome TaxID=412755 RepID=A0A0F9VMG2_9ZZZZ